VKIRILDLAEGDILAGFDFYDRQSAGVGPYFIECLFSDIDSLCLYAGTHRKVLGYFRMLSKRFPYAVYYTMEKNEVLVWRVLDCRQNPGWIKSQLKRRLT